MAICVNNIVWGAKICLFNGN